MLRAVASHLRPREPGPELRPAPCSAPAQRHEPPPYHWLEPLRVPEEERPPIFDWEVVRRTFDNAAFLRDGCAVFESLWLPEARGRLGECSPCGALPPPQPAGLHGRDAGLGCRVAG